MMTNTIPRLGLALLAATMIAGPASAQGVPGVKNGVLTGPVVGGGLPTAPHTRAPPPALPGSHTNAAEAAPLDRPPSDMGPNEALFDAINRGDLAAARDAIGRGADLHATNVLGLTPTELAIDLSRNEITFLLLSLRGPSGSSNGPPAATPPGKTAKAEPVRAAAHAPHPAPHGALVATAPRPAPVQAPRQYADTPGTPVPQAGFLGFGGAMR